MTAATGGEDKSQPSASQPEDVPERAIAQPGTVGVVVYDASCLFGKHLRYMLLGFAVYGIARARWSTELLGETAGALARELRGDSLQDLGQFLRDEAELVRDGLVDGYQQWMADLALPDDGDRHVLAAAIECGAATVVTNNVKDFPAEVLGPYGIRAEDGNQFLVRCIEMSPVISERLVSEHPDPERLLRALDGGAPAAAGRLRLLL